MPATILPSLQNARDDPSWGDAYVTGNPKEITHSHTYTHTLTNAVHLRVFKGTASLHAHVHPEVTCDAGVCHVPISQRKKLRLSKVKDSGGRAGNRSGTLHRVHTATAPHITALQRAGMSSLPDPP